MNDVLVTLSKEAAGYVEDLVRLNIDSAQGFTAAADMIEDKSLAASFREYAAQRDANAEELKAAIAYNGEEPPQGGTASGTLHRWWLEVKGKITSGNAHSVLSEAERGEDNAMARYRKALKQPLPAGVKLIVERQMQGVQRNHDQVKMLRDQFRAA